MTAPIVDHPSTGRRRLAARARSPGASAWPPPSGSGSGSSCVVLPDGSRRAFGDATRSGPGRDPHPRPPGARSDARRTARPAAARRTWTACGPARTSPACSVSPRVNREALALSAGWFRVPAQLRQDARASRPAEHPRGQPPEHRRPLRPVQRPLPAVPRRDDDLLERGVRDARPGPGRRAAQQVPDRRRERRAGARPARPRDRDGLGRLRAVRGGRARLSRDVGHDLARAVRAGARTGPRGRARATSSTSSCATIATSRARTTRSSRSRCSKPSARSTSARSSRCATERCDPGGRMSLQSITFPDAAYERQRRGANWIQTYIFPGGPLPVARRHRTRDARHPPAHRRRDRHRRLVRADAAGLARAVHVSPRRCARPGVRRAVHPDVGVLPRAQRGRLRHRASARTSRSCWRRGAGSGARERRAARPKVAEIARHRATPSAARAGRGRGSRVGAGSPPRRNGSRKPAPRLSWTGVVARPRAAPRRRPCHSHVPATTSSAHVPVRIHSSAVTPCGPSRTNGPSNARNPHGVIGSSPCSRSARMAMSAPTPKPMPGAMWQTPDARSAVTRSAMPTPAPTRDRARTPRANPGSRSRPRRARSPCRRAGARSPAPRPPRGP